MVKNGVRKLGALRQIAVNLEPCRNLKKISKLAKQYDAQKNEIHWLICKEWIYAGWLWKDGALKPLNGAPSEINEQRFINRETLEMVAVYKCCTSGLLARS